MSSSSYWILTVYIIFHVYGVTLSGLGPTAMSAQRDSNRLWMQCLDCDASESHIDYREETD